MLRRDDSFGSGLFGAPNGAERHSREWLHARPYVDGAEFLCHRIVQPGGTADATAFRLVLVLVRSGGRATFGLYGCALERDVGVLRPVLVQSNEFSTFGLYGCALERAA